MHCTHNVVLWRIALCCIFLTWPVGSSAQETGRSNASPSLAERIKERWKEHAQQRNGPAAGAVQSAAALTLPGDYAFSMAYQGHQRSYRMHVPASYRAGVPAALVLSLHGGGGNMDYQANDAYYGQISKSEQMGFIAVFPNGYSRLPGGQLATWNAGNCCGGARDAGADDVGFIRALVERLHTQLNIDRKRIFANGMSNGGMMAYRLACEAPDLFRAIASVAGTDNTSVCTPSQPISVLHIHARDDDMVLFNGGAGRERAAVTDFVSVPSTVSKWVGLNGCPAKPQRVLEVSGALCELYTPCRGGVEVKLCVTDTGAHSWPGGTKVRGGAPGSTALSATDVIADFYLSR